jgi:3-hydroxybutyrate dehydrogenase
MALNGKNVLVTGSSNGLGLAMATALAASGCNIVLHGLEPAQSVEQTTAELASSYDVSVSYVRADLSTVEGVDARVETARARVGSIDVLINNAVVRHFARIESFALEHWHRALAVNLTAAFRAIQLTLPGMRERGWGRIFNMTSVYGARATANRVDYVTTKTALLGLTRSVAVETLNQGITCNAICPGSVLTTKNLMDARRSSIRLPQSPRPCLRTKAGRRGADQRRSATPRIRARRGGRMPDRQRGVARALSTRLAYHFDVWRVRCRRSGRKSPQAERTSDHLGAWQCVGAGGRPGRNARHDVEKHRRRECSAQWAAVGPAGRRRIFRSRRPARRRARVSARERRGPRSERDHGWTGT